MLFLSNDNSVLHDASNTLTICFLCFKNIVIEKAFSMFTLISSVMHVVLHLEFCMLSPGIVVEKIFWHLFLLPYYNAKLIFIIYCLKKKKEKKREKKKEPTTKQPRAQSTHSCTFWRYFQLSFQIMNYSCVIYTISQNNNQNEVWGFFYFIGCL